MKSLLVSVLRLALLGPSAAFADTALYRFLFWGSVGAGLGKGARAYADQRDERGKWDANIAKLEAELAACGNCSNRDKIQEQLNYWKGTKSSFEEIVCSVLDTMGTGDPKWKAGWTTLLQVPCPAQREGRLSDKEVLERLRKEGTPEKCIALFTRYQACEQAAGFQSYSGSGGPCRDPFKLYQHCKSGDVAALAQELETQRLRALGKIVPEIQEGARLVKVYYGDTPDDFVPPVPSTSLLGDKHLLIEMRKKLPGRLDLIRVWFFNPLTVVAQSGGYNAPGAGDVFAMVKLEPKPLVIECRYVHEKKGLSWRYTYWFETRPAAANRDALRARNENHLLLTVGSARSDCPGTAQEARLALTQPDVPPDPAVVVRQKIASLARSAGKTCEKTFDRPEFCKCAITNLQAADLEEAHWQSLSSDFHTVANLGAKRDAAMDAVRRCYKR